MVRSGASTTVGSLLELFELSASPGTETAAEFTTEGAAPPPTATVSVTDVLVAAGIELGCVHVTTWPTALQVHPEPVPDTNVSPLGRVSVTVVVPDVLMPPVFSTVRRYVPLVPAA